ncbi:MAG: hypothetical protein CVV06_11910 [Gammaproteobacteria bacterium HGW-Gammaproteobacteria-10]|nr:MAG: hypothetical protein CVV06_11910 [Gammaproteobacteria bacterium HGW-Gammaproteobacteria-10]
MIVNESTSISQFLGRELDEVCISFYPGLSSEYLSSFGDEKNGSETDKSEKAYWSYRSELDEHEIALVD